MMDIINASHEWAESNNIDIDEYTIYQYLEETPKASLPVEIVNNLNKLGYKISKTEKNG